MKKILFLIHDLGQGGAEKVLVNLVNNMNRSSFDITVISLFGGGVNEQFLNKEINYKTVFKNSFPGNSRIMKLFSPQFLHSKFIKEKYDIEVSYLEGPSARIISGCKSEDTKLVSWIHVEQHTMKTLAASFRNSKEARRCYDRFDQVICVSEFVKQDFSDILDYQKPCMVLYNTVESNKIREKSFEPIQITMADKKVFRIIAIGTLKESKGYKRLFSILHRLYNEGYLVHLYVLGVGPQQKELEKILSVKNMNNYVSLLGYDTNPYRYLRNCDLFVCSSYSEGFSTAATEALITGTPVCTVDVSGMKEMLGENNEYGIVTENNEEALYQGIRTLIESPELLAKYKHRAEIRGKRFSTDSTVHAVEQMLNSL